MGADTDATPIAATLRELRTMRPATFRAAQTPPSDLLDQLNQLSQRQLLPSPPKLADHPQYGPPEPLPIYQSHCGNMMRVNLASAAAKLKVPEERLRGTLLSLKDARLQTPTFGGNRSPLAVTLPCSEWERRYPPNLLPPVTPPGRMRVREGPLRAGPKSGYVNGATQTPPRLIKTPSKCGFGFAGGVRGPSAILRNELDEMHKQENAADVRWMERYMPNANKSTSKLDRQLEATKKDKPSVSEYHDQLLHHKPSTNHLNMRRFSTLTLKDRYSRDRVGHGPPPPLWLVEGIPMPPIQFMT